MPHSTARSHFMAGARDTLPMLVGAAPFGMIFGALAGAAQLAPWQGQLMSLGVFAGSSQFIAVGLMAGLASMLVIWLATLIVNLRHMLYAAALLPHVQHLPGRWRWLLGFLLTDETFAVVDSYYRQHPQATLGHWYFLGSGVAMYTNWQGWTLIGLAFGAVFPQLQTLGLDFAMVVTFIAIVVPQLVPGASQTEVSRGLPPRPLNHPHPNPGGEGIKPQQFVSHPLSRVPHLGAALAAGTVAYALKDLPFKLGLMAAVVVGVGVGMGLTRLRARAAAKAVSA